MRLGLTVTLSASRNTVHKAVDIVGKTSQKSRQPFDVAWVSLLLSQVFRGKFLTMSAFVIDAFEFGRSNGLREGATPVAEMQRLTNDLADNSGTINWSVKGGVVREGYPSLTLAVSGTVQLVCQRCLAPFAYTLDSSTMLVLGKDDEEADQIEEILDNESIDVIVGSRTCDFRDLLEDEALLALPQVPKHDVCPATPMLDALKSDKPSPFAGLQNLKSE